MTSGVVSSQADRGRAAVRWIRIGLVVVLCIHGAITAVSMKADGLLSPFPPFERLHTLQIFSDLVSASLMLLLLIAAELRRQGRSLRPVPLLLVGITLSGSFTPLLFLLLDRGFLPGLFAPAPGRERGAAVG